MRYDKAEVFIPKYDEPLIVSFDYYKGSPGSMYKRNGDPGDPPEAAEVDLRSASLNGIDVLNTLSGDEQDELIDACFTYVDEDEGPDEYER